MPTVEGPKLMHVRSTLLCFSYIFFWALFDADMSSAQSSSLEEAVELYHENYLRAATAQNSGDYSGAEEWHRTNLILMDSTPGVPPEARVQARFNLASAIMMQNRLDEAESILDEAQGVADANPQIHPVIKAYLLTNRGGLKLKKHELVSAEEMLGEGVAILEIANELSNAASAASAD